MSKNLVTFVNLLIPGFAQWMRDDKFFAFILMLGFYSSLFGFYSMNDSRMLLVSVGFYVWSIIDSLDEYNKYVTPAAIVLIGLIASVL